MGGVKVRAQGEDGESSIPCAIDPRPTCSSAGSAEDDTKVSSFIKLPLIHLESKKVALYFI